MAQNFRRQPTIRFQVLYVYLVPARRHCGGEFRKDVKAMGIEQVLSAPRAPWRRAYLERVAGTVRRECLDHVIVFNEASLHRHVKAFLDYYHETGSTCP